MYELYSKYPIIIEDMSDNAGHSFVLDHSGRRSLPVIFPIIGDIDEMRLVFPPNGLEYLERLSNIQELVCYRVLLQGKPHSQCSNFLYFKIKRFVEPTVQQVQPSIFRTGILEYNKCITSYTFSCVVPNHHNLD